MAQSRMEILWLSHNVPYPPIGGVLQRNHNLIKEIASRHNVHLVAFNQKALLPTEKQIEDAKAALKEICSQVKIISIPCDLSKVKWIALVIGSIFSRDSYSINWLKSRRMHLLIEQVVKAQHFDVVHYDTISLAEYFCATGSIPKVLNHHNIESAMMLRRAKNENNLAKRIYYYLESRKLTDYEKMMCPKFHANLTVSMIDKSNLLKLAPTSRIEVVPNGVDVEFFKPQDNGKAIKNSLVFSGRLDSYPNRDALRFFIRQIWPIVKHDVPTARFTIVGKNPPHELGKMCRREPAITLIGPTVDVRPYIQSSEAYVCPIRDGGGTRLKLLDAMAMGKAIISTTLAYEGLDAVAERDLLVADAPEAFAEQIKRVFRNKELRESLGKSARRLVEENYSWKKIGSGMCAVYESINAG